MSIPSIFDNSKGDLDNSEAAAVIFVFDSDMIELLSMKPKKGGLH